MRRFRINRNPKAVAKEQLIETSAKLKITIYGDWTGGMFAAYRMRDNDSNFVIIDKRGIVRYAASGRIANSRFEAIKKLLLELAKAPGPSG